MTTPPYPELLSLVDERSSALRDAAAGNLEARVPGCPDWKVRDLVEHLGEVHRFWAATVLAGPSDTPPSAAAIGDRTPSGDLFAWSAESTRLLVDALRDTDPDRGCWTWWGASGAPMTAGAVARHQVQEAAVHAYDAQDAAGRAEPVPAAIAVDAVPEFLQVSLGSLGKWPHRPARLALSAVEGPTWLLDLTPEGATPDPAPSGEPVATVRASASDLLLILFKRIGLDAVTITGDRAVVGELLSWIDNE